MRTNILTEYSLKECDNGSLKVEINGGNDVLCNSTNKSVFWDKYCGDQLLNVNINISEVYGPMHCQKVVLGFSAQSSDLCEFTIVKIQKVIEDQIKDISPLSLYCVVLSDKNDTKNYRVYFPFLRCTTEAINTIRSNVIARMPNLIFTDYPLSCPLYGSDSYVYVSAKDHRCDLIPEATLKDLFCWSNHQDFFKRGIPKDVVSLQAILPVLLSVRYEVDCSALPKLSKSSIESDWTSKSFFTSLLKLIPSDILLNYDVWIKVGECIFNSFEREEGFTLWLNITKTLFSQFKSDHKVTGKVSLFECVSEKNMYKFMKKKYASTKSMRTVKTIAWYARLYNAQGYSSFIDAWSDTEMEKLSTKPSTRDISNLFFTRYWLCFASVKGGKWWSYSEKRQRWIRDEDGIGLKNKMNEGFLQYLKNKCAQFELASKTCSDAEMKLSYTEKCEMLFKLCKDLGEPVVKSRMLTELDIKLRDESFSEYLDAHPAYFVTENYVFESVHFYRLGEGKKKTRQDGVIIARPGMPEDYKSKGSDIRADLTLNKKSSVVQKAIKWLTQVYSDVDIFKYVLLFFSSMLRGGNPDKLAVSFIGKGNNGKTAVLNVLQLILGEDCAVISIAALSSGAQKGSATPELNFSWCAKICVVSEMGPQDKIDVKEYKSISSGDPRYRRDLYESGRKCCPLSKLVFFANVMNPIIGADLAAVNRTVIIPHRASWSSTAPINPKDQVEQQRYPMNKRFEEKHASLALGLLWLMVHEYSKYVRSDLNVKPDLIQQMTNNYWLGTDVYLQFIQLHIVPVENEDGTRDLEVCITPEQMYNAYLKHILAHRPSAKQPNLNTVVNAISERIGDIYMTGWWGIGFKSSKGEKVEALNEGNIKTAARISNLTNFNNNVLGNRVLMFESA